MKQKKQEPLNKPFRLIDQLNDSQREEFEKWKRSPEASNLLRKRYRGRSENEPDPGPTTGVSASSRWKQNESAGGGTTWSADFSKAMVPPLIISKPLKIFLLGVVLLAITSLVIIFYITIHTFKDHSYPKKSSEQRSFRLR